MKQILLWVLRYAGLALLGGVVLLALAIHSIYSASNGGGIPPESKLTSVSGHVTDAQEVVSTVKSRRGGKRSSTHYELNLNPASGETMKLRVDGGVPRFGLEAIVDGDVTVKYDAEDDNNIYVIRLGNQDLMSYADMALMMQGQADHEKDKWTSGKNIGLGVLLTLLGGGGIWWRRKLLAAG
jgi:hypothetical protein